MAALHADFGPFISRRDIDGVVARARERHKRRCRSELRHVTWHLPNLAWAIDATLLRTTPGDPGMVAVLGRDLASHFHFRPLLLPAESASENQLWLERLFCRHGLPFFLKRDNGSPFNEQNLNDFLADHWVLPINSPVGQPRYNGAIEHGIGSTKPEVLAGLDPDRPVIDQERQLLALLFSVTHLHNARPRRSLAGFTPAQAFHHPARVTWNKVERYATFEWISTRAAETLESKCEKVDHHTCASAWRGAVVAWLRRQHLITVSTKPQLSPIFA